MAKKYPGNRKLISRMLGEKKSNIVRLRGIVGGLDVDDPEVPKCYYINSSGDKTLYLLTRPGEDQDPNELTDIWPAAIEWVPIDPGEAESKGGWHGRLLWRSETKDPLSEEELESMGQEHAADEDRIELPADAEPWRQMIEAAQLKGVETMFAHYVIAKLANHESELVLDGSASDAVVQTIVDAFQAFTQPLPVTPEIQTWARGLHTATLRVSEGYRKLYE